MLAVMILAEALALVIVVAAVVVVAVVVFCGTGVQKAIIRRYTCSMAALSETGAAYKSLAHCGS